MCIKTIHMENKGTFGELCQKTSSTWLTRPLLVKENLSKMSWSVVIFQIQILLYTLFGFITLTI
ncbi:hypothetical protein A2348_03660 [Candidatus Uhrbacteria bacterium RIFOXYB12_FULL_58_10]|nr:MAG: hypothetical protein A2348_03660 [Candidatus Uhrbacteria bacterium RIFOXYB12_FULL_58_10]